MQDKLLRVIAEIDYLSREINKLKEQKESTLKQYNELKKNCTHKYLNGDSAIRGSWEFDTCDICGCNF